MTKLQLSYTVLELSILLGLDRRTVVRWLEENDVPIRKVGRERVVWLADLNHHVPEFERSLVLKRQGQGCI